MTIKGCVDSWNQNGNIKLTKNTSDPTMSSADSDLSSSKDIAPDSSSTPALLPQQKAFIYAKEIGTHILGITSRTATSSWIKVESFDQVLNNFKTSYFAGALLLGRAQTAAGLHRIFRSRQFRPESWLGLMSQLNATPEIFFYRIGQLAYAEFGLENHYFMRLNSREGKQSFDVTKLLNLSGLSLPRGLSANEHYCRKWAGMRLLRARGRQREIALPDLPARSGPTIAAQRAFFIWFKSGNVHLLYFQNPAIVIF